MADECLLAIPEIEGIDYTTKEYLNFVWHIQNTADRLGRECKYVRLHCLFFFVFFSIQVCNFKLTISSVQVMEA